MLAGHLCQRTVQRVLPRLREIGVINYETPVLRGPITFRLLSVATQSRNVATVSDSPSVSHNRSNKEEHKKNKEEKVSLLVRNIPEEDFTNCLIKEFPHRVAEWNPANAPEHVIACYHRRDENV